MAVDNHFSSVYDAHMNAWYASSVTLNMQQNGCSSVTKLPCLALPLAFPILCYLQQQPTIG